MEIITFTNKYYKSEWKLTTRDGSLYAEGTIVKDEYSKRLAVYDGARNCMGWLEPVGKDYTFILNGNTEYTESFLKSAKEVLLARK